MRKEHSEIAPTLPFLGSEIFLDSRKYLRRHIHIDMYKTAIREAFKKKIITFEGSLQKNLSLLSGGAFHNFFSLSRNDFYAR